MTKAGNMDSGECEKAVAANTADEDDRLDEQTSYAIPVPGTVELVDIQGKIQTQHAGSTSDIVLVPTPSSDPQDPLNWSSNRKRLALISNCVYVLMVGIASAAIYSVLTPISESTSLSIGDLNAGTGYLFLAFGWSCLFWQPIAMQFGKRPVYLFSILATCMTQVWAGYIKTNDQWIANKVLQGFFGAPIESLCEITMADLFFQHERGTYIAVYGLLLAGSNYFAPIISGFIADGQGWPWVLYWCAIFCAAGFIFLFLFMEETNYPGRIPAPLRPLPQRNDNLDDHDKMYAEQFTSECVLNSIAAPPRPDLRAHFSLLHSRSLKQPLSTHLSLNSLLRPLRLLTYPIILWPGFAYGSALIWFNVLNATTSSILSAPPYNFPASSVGLSYIAAVLGVILAAVYTGPIGDRIVLHLARRNGGILESEHRLWLYVPIVLLTPSGLILWGIGAAEQVHWFGLLVGMCIIAFINTAGLQLSISYAVDSYRALCADAVVAVILVRNTMSFGVNYGITPWIQGMGLKGAFGLAAGVGALQMASFVIFIWFGKKWRISGRWRYEKEVASLTSHQQKAVEKS